MRNFSGLVLDPYDDPSRVLVSAVFPHGTPPVLKSAADLSAKLASLPDALFALRLTNEGESMRKLATVDAGNTALSTLYFMHLGGVLPPEAQKMAAANLCLASDWYGLRRPDSLEKIAFGGLIMKGLGAVGKSVVNNPLGAVGKVMTGMSLAGAGKAMGANLSQAAGAGGSVLPLSSFGGLTVKLADLSGTDVMPYQENKPKKPAFQEYGTMKHAYLDVSGRDNQPDLVKRAGGRFCLANPSRYPIDDALQIKTASEYFDDNYRSMSPVVRREYATNLYKRAEECAFAVSEDVQRYGAPTLGSHEHCKEAWAVRRRFAEEKDVGLLDKIASAHLDLALPNEDFAALMHAFDKKAGLDRLYDTHITDPWGCLFAPVKLAEFSEILGTDMITATGLHSAAQTETGRVSLNRLYDKAFVLKFMSDPVGTYKSLPVEQRKLLGRVAMSNGRDGRGLHVGH